MSNNQQQQPKKSNSIGDPRLPLWVKIFTAGSAACVGELLSIPFDTAKVRLQIQGQLLKPGDKPKYTSLLNCLSTIAKEEGPKSIFNGVTAGFQRQMVFAGLRIGLYDGIKNMIVPKEQADSPSMLYKIAAALATGSIAISIACPTEVVKIRLQAQGRPGVPIRYKGALDAYPKIIQQEGILGLWTGIRPNIFRNAIINAAELATYDQCRQTVLNNKLLNDGIFCHVLCSTAAGLTAAVIGSPADCIKTRIMNGGNKYTGIYNCASTIIKEEGFAAFYAGFSSNCVRMVSFNVILFVSLEKFRGVASEMWFPSAQQN